MKATESAYKFYEGLPSWGKAALIIGGGAIAWFGVLNPIRKVIMGKLDMAKMAKEGKDARDAISDLSRKGIKPTITDAQAQSFANSLVSSFSGCGTDESAIYGVMSQLKNDADVYKLISTYGIRKYDECGPWTGNVEGSLSAAISDELDIMEKQQVNTILKKNGVKFQFT